ncbi:phosphoethanolamine transferase [Comamonas serinivorans]|uniref:Phosphoethanolamine transferase n=1 Tax=Comamonas serinivorans TaxID=1082851 RepID=A0A1Y0ELP3_9BURK|nr:sulfatase-like hydrolase/transferase [Comamonas serinivorans]ARU04563.1 phosphoethanolamine transferase [Comamonas serinivorans]
MTSLHDNPDAADVGPRAARPGPPAAGSLAAQPVTGLDAAHPSHSTAPSGALPAAPRATALQRVRHWLTQPRTPQAVVALLAAWLVLTANWALMSRLGHLDGAADPAWVLRLGFGGLSFLAVLSLLALTAWPRGMKPVWVALALVAALAQHFMLSYGTVMDKGMIHNALQTDWRESRDLASPWLLLQVLVIAGVPALWLWRQPLRRDTAWRGLGRTAVLFAGSVGLLLAGVLGGYRHLGPLVRNNMELRFMINPVSPVLAALDAGVKPWFKHARPFASIAAGATLAPARGDDARPPLLVLVVGETARADHFSLNGYGRDTNPELARHGVLSWHQASSCGTATRESVPCMFSHLDRQAFLSRKVDYDGLLDVLQTAGLAVLWVDNQAGCKGVCDRTPHVTTADELATPAGRRHCDADGECRDGMLVDTLSQRLASLPPERARRGVVLVLHQMGSHGPAYHKRSDAAHKAFSPECTTNALADCSHEQLINAYDNTIRTTDHVLAGVIDWLQAQPQYAAGMLYVSDHGESLGENGLYLHGMPWRMAPEVQKHVPWILWLDGLQRRSGVDLACAAHELDQPISHDHYYHTVLGLLGVRTPTYLTGLDTLASCRRPAAVAADL